MIADRENAERRRLLGLAYESAQRVLAAFGASYNPNAPSGVAVREARLIMQEIGSAAGRNGSVGETRWSDGLRV